MPAQGISSLLHVHVDLDVLKDCLSVVIIGAEHPIRIRAQDE